MLGLFAASKGGMVLFRRGCVGPGARTLAWVAASLCFFFVNLSLIYYYVQTTVQHEGLQRSERGLMENDLNLMRRASDDNRLLDGKCVLDSKNALAASALDRVKSSECRQQIEEAACRLQNGAFHDTMPLTGCHNFDERLAGVHMGCFEDHLNDRQLKGHDYVFEDNNRRKCESHCYRAGYLYYGVEYGKECFCGDDFQAQYTVANDKCLAYTCSGNESEFCGGHKAIDIFRTGLIVKAAALVRKPTYVPIEKSNSENTVRIMFLMQLNGRNVRQVRRLLKAIYSPRHFYYIHVDQRQRYMLTEMQKLETLLPNVFVQPDGQSTIWGGASLLKMVQTAINRTLLMPGFSDWDYVVNLSESDFPVLSLSEFEAQLTENRGRSFLASHGYDTARFIQKQGFDFVFVECEERMWRIGKRDEFPRGLRIDGGSDWIILHKDFASFSVSSDELPTKLRKLFSSIILPVESFFHTLAANSIYCDDVVSSNLRLTNWNRKQGCRCASLKKVVDWCGCSPLVFKGRTTEKFELERSKDKSYYFARKFENLIDVDAIAAAERQALRDRPHLIQAESPSFNTTHVNFYERSVDGVVPTLEMLARSLSTMSPLYERMEFGSLKSMNVYKESSTDDLRIVVTIETLTESSPIELLVEKVPRKQIYFPATVDGYRLLDIQFGTNIDHKEEIFRGYSGFVDQTSSPTILLKWERVPMTVTTVPMNKTSPGVKFLWKDESGALVATQTLRPYDSQNGAQFADLILPNLKLLKKNQTGMWSVTVMSEEVTVARIEVPIYDPEDEGSFEKLTPLFYKIADSCSHSKCSSFLWSTLHPDPKSDIVSGYDSEKDYLV